MDKPKVDAPGLEWRKRKYGWECLWRARPDLMKRGWVPKHVRLFQPTKDYGTPTAIAVEWISDRANALQTEMLVWGRGGLRPDAIYTGTWDSLIDCYKTDKDSPYNKKVRYATRNWYDTLCKRIHKDLGKTRIADTDARAVLRFHEQWAKDGKLTMGHSCINMMRTLLSFGGVFLKCKDCKSLRLDLHDMKFQMPKARSERLTAEMVLAIRALAPSYRKRSIALAQAFQFDLMLRQKDVIGEWVPVSEPGISDVIDRNEKWLRGIRWEEIDKNLILRHTTSKRQKDIEVDLKLAPMVMEELRFGASVPEGRVLVRAMLPASGPIVVDEITERPYSAPEFRTYWRKIATAAGVPKHVRNMDTRAGAITEATEAGAPLEHIKHAATHSDIAMTQRYARGSQEKTAEVMKIRASYRVKKVNE